MPTSSNGKNPRSRGRTGHRWNKARARVLRASQICAHPDCGELIDMSLTWPDPRSATVDHWDISVADLEWDDERLYDPKHLKPMHLVCNQRKGAGKVEKPQHPTSRRWAE